MLIQSFSGVRGLFGEDITDDIAKRYAKAYLDFLLKTKGKPLIVIGRDTRPSSERLKDDMVELFLQHTDVVDLGINTTPAVEFAVRHLKADGGVIITGSHNEPEFNGWKFLNSTGSILEPNDMEEVISNFKAIKKIERKKFSGKLEDVSISSDYISSIVDNISEEEKAVIAESKLKVVADPNGGTAAIVIKDVLDKLGVEIVEMNMDLGVFKRKIEPNMHTLKKVSEEVKKSSADFGAGFDCDADRVELVDEEGNMISGNYVLALAVEEVLSNYKGSNRVIVINDATSNVIKEVAKKHNAKVEEVEVGEINVVKRMYELKSPVSGEGSNGGVIIPPARCREGLMTVVAIIRLLARTKKKISEICEEFPKYYTPRQALSSDVDTIRIKELIEKKFRDKGYDIRKTGDETGGLKVIFDEKSWLWFRNSKTEVGSFRIIADSDDEEKADEILEEGVKAFREAEAELR